MSPAETKAEFRRYRQVLQALTYGSTGLVIAWLLASVGHVLFVHPPLSPRSLFSGRAEDIEALLTCQTDVEELFNDVNLKLFDLQQLGARYDIEMVEQWESFSKRWKQRWREAGARCRFHELANHGLGPAYDHLAAVHDQLEEVQRAYRELLQNYIDHHAARVDDIRRTLEASRRAFEKARAATGLSASPQRSLQENE